MKDSLINFNELTAKEVFNKFRACEKPYEAFYFDLNKKIIIKKSKDIKKKMIIQRKTNIEYLDVKKNFVLVNY